MPGVLYGRLRYNSVTILDWKVRHPTIQKVPQDKNKDAYSMLRSLRNTTFSHKPGSLCRLKTQHRLKCHWHTVPNETDTVTNADFVGTCKKAVVACYIVKPWRLPEDTTINLKQDRQTPETRQIHVQDCSCPRQTDYNP
jgi:hypothetical protein